MSMSSGVSAYRTCRVPGCTRRMKGSGGRCWDCANGRAPGATEKRLRVAPTPAEVDLAITRIDSGATVSEVAHGLGVQIVPLQRAVRAERRERAREMA